MGKSQREKGKRGEREVVDLFKAFGFDARRGQQHKGTNDSPDVIVIEAPVQVEVKRRQNMRLYNWMDKLDEEAGTNYPILFFRPDNKKWVSVMYAEDLLDILSERYLQK